MDGVTVRVAVVEEDLAALPLPELRESAKSGAGGAVIATVTAEEVEVENAVLPP